MVLGTGFLLLVSLALTTFLSAMTGSLGGMFPGSETLIHVLNFVVSFAVISVLFAMIFKVLPDVRVPIKKVWVGAIVTALLFTVGKYLLALYLGRESTRSPYGAAGSVIVILMWVYYASLILFLGAEFTQVYVKATSKRIEPNKYAVPVIEEERAEEGIPHDQGAGEHYAPVRKGRRVPPRSTPGVVVRADPVGFLTLMLVSGFVGGALLSFKTVRKGLRLCATFAR
jgi:membrane protein